MKAFVICPIFGCPFIQVRNVDFVTVGDVAYTIKICVSLGCRIKRNGLNGIIFRLFVFLSVCLVTFKTAEKHVRMVNNVTFCVSSNALSSGIVNIGGDGQKKFKLGLKARSLFSTTAPILCR